MVSTPNLHPYLVVNSGGTPLEPAFSLWGDFYFSYPCVAGDMAAGTLMAAANVGEMSITGLGKGGAG